MTTPHPTEHERTSTGSPFRPAPARAASMQALGYKTRAASQPAGERIPLGPGGIPAFASPSLATHAGSQPTSGRASPHVNGAGYNGLSAGARPPGRFAGALAAGTQTRANSFSAAELKDRGTTLNRVLSSHLEEHPSRSSSDSPYPTFSPASSPSTSPIAQSQQLPSLHNHSPPLAGANASRSRSQSLATGPRPDRNMFPMSAFQGPVSAVSGRFNWDSPPAGNQSPFSRQTAGFEAQASRFKMSDPPGSAVGAGAWGSSAPESTSTAALTSSVVKALGAAYQVGGFDVPYTAAIGNATGGAGNKSGASSRRHSVSVVGGPGGRRDMFESSGFGMTSPPVRPSPGKGSARWTDAELLPERFDNALSLNIQQRRGSDVLGRKGVDIPSSANAWKASGTPASSVPTSALFGRPMDPFAEPSFGSSPRGRVLEGMSQRSDGSQGSSNRVPAGTYDQPIASPARAGFLDSAMRAPGAIGAGPRSAGLNGPSMSGEPPGYPAGNTVSPFGPPGAPPFRPHQQYPQGSTANPYTTFRPPMEYQPFYPGRPYQGGPGGQIGPGGPSGMQGGFSPGMAYGSLPNIGGPGMPGMGGGMGNGLGGGYGGPGQGPGNYTGSFYPPSSPPQFAPPLPGAPGSSSPGFSTLSLADLGKGVPLASLAPTTPLYIVVFKAGRRDVYYCPDPTLLISNGDRVIVEADRGSDLGTVIYDQLTPIDVRDWQESQATKALLSGAREHLPPGLVQQQQQQQAQKQGQGQGQGSMSAQDGQRSPISKKVSIPGGAGQSFGDSGGAGFGGPGGGQMGTQGYPADADTQGLEMDLSSLLSGCGPTGASMEVSGAYVPRGPLAKEVMPKRIFAKSAQGAEEQARMLEKRRDEYEAMMVCREKVRERGLPMSIVDAEYQWDRRKLTFYFKADRRVDFRDLTKENFRIFKSRIWMSMVPKDDPRH